LRLTPSRSAARASSPWSVRGIRSRRRPLCSGSSDCLTALKTTRAYSSRLRSGSGWSSLGEIEAHLAERFLQQPAHLDLRESDCRADLGLAQIAEVAQPDDQPLAAIERACGRGDERTGDADVVQLHRSNRFHLVVHGRGGAERRHQRRVVLEVSRHPKRIAAVAEVTFDLAFHAHGGIRRELPHPALVAAVDGSDQRHVPDLDEIVEWLSAPGEAARDRADKRQVAFDHPSPRSRRVAGPQRCEHRHEINARSFSRGLQTAM
jgi:hypothetical protein